MMIISIIKNKLEKRERERKREKSVKFCFFIDGKARKKSYDYFMTKNERKVNGCLLVLVVDGRKSVKKYINYSGVWCGSHIRIFFL